MAWVYGGFAVVNLNRMFIPLFMFEDPLLNADGDD